MGYPAPTPQAGRVTHSHGGKDEGWGGGKVVPCLTYMDLDRLIFYIDYEALSAVGKCAELN
jgi:hypothetical protein